MSFYLFIYVEMFNCATKVVLQNISVAAIKIRCYKSKAYLKGRNTTVEIKRTGVNHRVIKKELSD